MLLREDVLPGEISSGALQDLVFQLKLPRFTAEPGELLFLRADQLDRAAILVSVGLRYPVPQA